MKTLYRVYYGFDDGLYFWADNADQAKELACQQGMNRTIEDAHADRVWANNITMKYRGYVVQE